MGAVSVCPSLRTITGPEGSIKGEPRVIQVLIALADARGKVLSRDDLLQLCWEGRLVGDDAINRAIAEVRRIAAAAGAEFEVETVARVGYRITGVEWPADDAAIGAATSGGATSRRKFVLASAGAVALAATGAAAIIYRSRQAKIDNLLEQGRLLQGSGQPDGKKRAEALFREAIQLDPKRADAWGWLAIVLPESEAEREAALRALALDPREPNARTVLAFQRRDLEAWTQWEDNLLGITSDAPDCAAALSQLTFFYQGMGRCEASWMYNEQEIRVEPFNPAPQFRRAIKHWIFGRIGDADKVANRALELWPRNSGVWNARMLLFAFSGRAPAALALLDDVSRRPASLTIHSERSWRAALTAISTRSTGDINTALEVCTAAARLAPGLAANAIMVFSDLGKLDAAYQVAAGLLESRGPIVQHGGNIMDLYSGSLWGRTQFLFIPATTPFRADPRFPELCRRLGHVAYWQKRGIWPDRFVRGALDPAQLT